LGDNLFYGVGLGKSLKESFYTSENVIFAHQVKDPRAYGVVELNSLNEPISIEEKPTVPKSNMAVTGLYKYGAGISKYARILNPSSRGELEITDLNRLLLDSGKLGVNILQRGTVWLDTGNPKDMLEAGNLVHAIEERQGMKIGCLEEIALNEGLIGIETFNESVLRMSGSSYGEYLQEISSKYLMVN
jgi:glucose-1-phosphate thymidylyltransferase